MTHEELIKNLKAYSAKYAKDSEYYRYDGNELMARYTYGKADAFLTAAIWLEEAKA